MVKVRTFRTALYLRVRITALMLMLMLL